MAPGQSAHIMAGLIFTLSHKASGGIRNLTSKFIFSIMLCHLNNKYLIIIKFNSYVTFKLFSCIIDFERKKNPQKLTVPSIFLQ